MYQREYQDAHPSRGLPVSIYSFLVRSLKDGEMLDLEPGMIHQ